MTNAAETSRIAPGPDSGLFGLGALREFQADMLGYVKRLAQHGDIVRFWLGPVESYLLSHPAPIYQVLVEDVERFPRVDRIKHVLGKLLGRGILLTDGAFWRRERRLVQPAFHHKRIEGYAEAMVAITSRMLARWQDGEVRDLSADMQKVTLDIVAKTLFDSEDDSFASSIHDVASRLQPAIGRRLRRLIDYDWVPTPENLQYRSDLAILDRIIRRIIAERRARQDDRGDLMSMLLLATGEDGSRLDDRQVRDEALTLFLAGHDTTSLTISWTFYLLVQHPEVEAKLIAELRDVLAGRAPTLGDLPRLKYTEQIVKEVLRLYPSAYFAARQAAEDTTLGGYRIRKGAQIFYFPFWVHRDPRFFEDPETFRPERWTETFEKSLPKCAYVPFGAGPHICIGNQFAMMEARLMLATIAQGWHMTRAPGVAIKPVPHITLYPSAPIRMRVERRS